MTPAIALHRFGFGPRPDEPWPRDPAAFLKAQLRAYSPHPPGLTAILPSTEVARRFGQDDARADPATRMAARRAARQALRQAINARTATAALSPTPFAERLVHFWSNHFAVSAERARAMPFVPAFEMEAIRPHILGRFADLLHAATGHPAMLLYLDQARSIGPDSPAAQRAAANGRQRGLNENLARELLELHTLGVRTGYDQGDVQQLAQALTGWTVGDDGRFLFNPRRHQPGARRLLGQRYADGGEAQGRAMIDALARHPATARHVATKLARHFISDPPPPVLVERLAAAYQRRDGDLPTLYQTLIEAAATTPGGRFKSPNDWLISALRTLGEVPAGIDCAALLDQLGQPAWRPPAPTGWGDRDQDWAAPAALMRRVEVAQRLADAAAPRDARALAATLAPAAQADIARAESPAAALALLLVAPTLLRR